MSKTTLGMVEDSRTVFSEVPLLLVVLFWLCLLFMSFGLFAPPNVTVMVALFLCALAVAGGNTNNPGPEQTFRGDHPSL